MTIKPGTKVIIKDDETYINLYESGYISTVYTHGRNNMKGHYLISTDLNGVFSTKDSSHRLEWVPASHVTINENQGKGDHFIGENND